MASRSVSGVGLGIVYPGATMTNVIRFFPDKRGLSSGLLAAGYGAGAILWAPVTVALIDQFGLMWALRILGGSISLSSPSAPAWCGRRPSGTHRQDGLLR